LQYELAVKDLAPGKGDIRGWASTFKVANEPVPEEPVEESPPPPPPPPPPEKPQEYPAEEAEPDVSTLELEVEKAATLDSSTLDSLTVEEKTTKEKLEETLALLNISILKGLKSESDGKLLNKDSVTVGELVEGDVAIIIKRKYACSVEGRFLNKKLQIVGRA